MASQENRRVGARSISQVRRGLGGEKCPRGFPTMGMCVVAALDPIGPLWLLEGCCSDGGRARIETLKAASDAA